MSWGGNSGSANNANTPVIAPPIADNLPQRRSTSGYSYLTEENEGYIRCIVSQARIALKEFGAELADMFGVADTEKQRRARAYFMSLDYNARQTLNEIHQKEKYRFDVC